MSNPKFLFTLLLIVLFAGIRAQDSVFFRSKDPVAAKVLEVGVSSIRYVRFDYQQGPVYECSKNAVLFIKYQGGNLERFKQVEEDVKPLLHQVRVREKLMLIDKQLVLGIKPVDKIELQKLITTYNGDPAVKARLQNSMSVLRKTDGNIQMLFVGAVLVLGTSLLVGSELRFNHKNQDLFTNTAVAGGVLALTSIFLIDEQMSKKQSVKRRIVELYNQDL